MSSSNRKIHCLILRFCMPPMPLKERSNSDNPLHPMCFSSRHWAGKYTARKLHKQHRNTTERSETEHCKMLFWKPEKVKLVVLFFRYLSSNFIFSIVFKPEVTFWGKYQEASNKQKTFQGCSQKATPLPGVNQWLISRRRGRWWTEGAGHDQRRWKKANRRKRN